MSRSWQCTRRCRSTFPANHRARRAGGSGHPLLRQSHKFFFRLDQHNVDC
ncbi:hypothetical protein C7S13_8801 [Burkholderia cepacia]|nr:hypothetical protein [Burkholderia cepacia]